MQTELQVSAVADYSETPFDRLVDDLDAARRHFAQLRGWGGCTPQTGGPEVRAAANDLWAAVGDVADARDEIPRKYGGATLEAKARVAGVLLVDSFAYGEPRLAKMATWLAKRAAAVHRDEAQANAARAIEAAGRA